MEDKKVGEIERDLSALYSALRDLDLELSELAIDGTANDREISKGLEVFSRLSKNNENMAIKIMELENKMSNLIKQVLAKY